MKRFTATEKWDDAWFRKLNPVHKCFWEFLCDKCDSAGVWQVDLEAAEFFIGAKLDEKELLESFKDRIQVLGKCRWFIKKFVEFQYGKLSKDCKPHLPIIRLLDGYGINFETLTKGYAKGLKTLEEKEKEKEKEKEGESEGNPYGLSGLGCRVATWFNRRLTTRWSERELAQLRKVEALKTPMEDINLLEKRYLSKDQWIRTDILTLLNNWNGEIDRAKGKTNGHASEQPSLPPWKRLELATERIKALTSEFNATRDEGKRQAIREEIQMARAEKDELESKTGATGI